MQHTVVPQHCSPLQSAADNTAEEDTQHVAYLLLCSQTLPVGTTASASLPSHRWVSWRAPAELPPRGAKQDVRQQSDSPARCTAPSVSPRGATSTHLLWRMYEFKDFPRVSSHMQSSQEPIEYSDSVDFFAINSASEGFIVIIGKLCFRRFHSACRHISRSHWVHRCRHARSHPVSVCKWTEKKLG